MSISTHQTSASKRYTNYTYFSQIMFTLYMNIFLLDISGTPQKNIEESGF